MSYESMYENSSKNISKHKPVSINSDSLNSILLNIAKEVNSPLSVIISAISLLKGPALNDKEKAAEYINMIERNAMQLYQYSQDINTLFKLYLLGLDSFVLRNVELVSLLKHFCDNLYDTIKECGNKIIFETSLKYAVTSLDSLLIEQGLLSFVIEACKNSIPGSTIIIRLTQEENRYGISLESLESKIDANRINDWFSKASQIGNLPLFKEYGIRTFLANTYLNLHDAVVTVGSLGEKGWFFKAELPIKIIESKPAVESFDGEYDNNFKLFHRAELFNLLQKRKL